MHSSQQPVGGKFLSTREANCGGLATRCFGSVISAVVGKRIVIEGIND